jgi:branched-chain amino acid transport system ATP-binding protein
MRAESALSFDDVSLSFGGLSVIRNLSFSIPKNTRSAIIGPNGAGKTTIFNILSGVYQPTAGRVQINGVDLTHGAMRERIRHGLARSFQNIRLVDYLTVYENFALGRQAAVAAGRSSLEVTGRAGVPGWASEVAARFNLTEHLHTPVAGLPYGTRKRIDLARALAAKPKILLLDEPAAGLDDAETEELRLTLTELSAGDLTVVVVEHDMNFVSKLCEHVIVIDFGEKIAEGTFDEVRNESKVKEAYLGAAA